LNTSILLDTSFLITLVDANRPHHSVAKEYYKLMIHDKHPMYFSTLVASEFSIKQSIEILPLSNFRQLTFGMTHAVMSAKLFNGLGQRDEGDKREIVREDIKLLAQATQEKIDFVITEDRSTFYKYCDRLRSAGLTQVRPIKLIDGFDPTSLDLSGQADLLAELSAQN